MKSGPAIVCEREGGEDMKKRIRFRIHANCTTLERVLEIIRLIRKAHPNAEIDVEVEVVRS